MSDSLSSTPSTEGRRKWFEIFGGVQVANTRLFLIALALGVAVVAEAFAIVVMSPLKTVVPYVIRVNNSGGVNAMLAAAQRFRPNQNEIAYGLARWIVSMLTLDHYLTGNPKHNNVLDAYVMTRGEAAEEFDDWFRKTEPLKAVEQDPSLTRVVHVRNWESVQNGEMIFSVRTVRRALNVKPVTKKWQITIQYVLVPPKTQAQIMSNPMGLYVTNFSITQDLD